MSTLAEKARALEAGVTARLVEREQESHTAVLAMFCRKHHISIGPPGVAKSLLTRTIVSLIDGLGVDGYYERQLNGFTTPEEVFGPFSLLGLQEDRFQRVTAGRLPRAVLANLDELGRAGKGILGTLNLILNERLHENPVPERVPLCTLWAASNSFLEGTESAALWDRLHFRHITKPISEPGALVQMLQRRLAGNAKPEPVMSWAEIEQAQAEVHQVKVPLSLLEAVAELRWGLRKDGVDPTDRRIGDATDIAQAEAWMRGGSEVEVEDLHVLRHVLWASAEEVTTVAKHVFRLSDPLELDAINLIAQVDIVENEFNQVLAATEEGSTQRMSGAVTVNGNLSAAVRDFTDMKQRAGGKVRDGSTLDVARKRMKALDALIKKEMLGATGTADLL